MESKGRALWWGGCAAPALIPSPPGRGRGGAVSGVPALEEQFSSAGDPPDLRRFNGIKGRCPLAGRVCSTRIDPLPSGEGQGWGSFRRASFGRAVSIRRGITLICGKSFVSLHKIIDKMWKMCYNKHDDLRRCAAWKEPDEYGQIYPNP